MRRSWLGGDKFVNKAQIASRRHRLDLPTLLVNVPVEGFALVLGVLVQARAEAPVTNRFGLQVRRPRIPEDQLQSRTAHLQARESKLSGNKFGQSQASRRTASRVWFRAISFAVDQ